MVGSATPYREPAEDEQAKLDAEEIARFERMIAREKAWQHRRVAVIALACLAALGGVAVVFSWSAKRTKNPRSALCHTVRVMHDDANGVLVGEDRIECPPPATP
jgi:hypothetical protein